MEIGAAAAAATAGGVGMGLFSYNRGNYMFDQKNHYARFTAGLNMAIAQTGMYKADIAQLTELTVTRQDCYHGIAAMGLTILTAIYCPGRLGLHTSPPPGWLMGLAFVNIAGCYLFLGLTLWLAMHASMRADTAATHMLTRFVRLPIPSQGMLDKARKFLSSFEEQPLKEVFRVPFTRHDHAGAGKEGGFNEDREIDAAAQKRARHGYDVPAWYKKEKSVDNDTTAETIDSMMPLDARGTAPEHFEAYRTIQHEWFPYDVYARLSIFLAFMHLTHCWAYMQIGHQLQETRAVFACAIVVLPMFVLQQIILTLDLIPSGLPIHRLGPFALWFAFIGACIEYKRWFSAEAQALGFLCAYIAYAIHIVYTLQLIRLCAPASEPPSVAESPGASWWPSEWQLPTAFQHAIWLVAPPKDLPEGQNDIVGELRDAQRTAEGGKAAAAGGANEAERRADVHRALGKQGESPAWYNVKAGLIALVLAWCFMTFGFTIEVINQGTAHPSLLSAPGVPNNARDPRYRPMKPGAHEPTEVGTGGLMGPARGVHMAQMHRRLSAVTDDAVDRQQLVQQLRTLLPQLRDVARSGGAAMTEAPRLALLASAPAVEAQEVPVAWPALFEPQVVASSPEATVALSRHGRGVVVEALETEAAAVSATFVLEGAAAHGPILAASLDASGLLVVTASGATLECAGTPAGAGGRWGCALLDGPKLPVTVGGAKPFAGSVAISRSSEGGLRAAVAYPGEQAMALFSRASRGSSPWLPAGEARTNGDVATSSFAHGGESLFFSTHHGEVARMSMADGGVAAVRRPNFPSGSRPSCMSALPSGRIAHLVGMDVTKLLVHDA